MSKSELDWDLSDYKKAGIEPPERILADPKACEGDLMTAEEVKQHISDSIGTLLTMIDRESPRLENVRIAFQADLDCLLKLSKISQDEYNEITSSKEMTI